MKTTNQVSRSNRLLLWTACIFAACALSILGSSTPNHTPPPSNLASSSGQLFPLEISPDPIDLGVIRAGESVRATLQLRNTRDEPLTLERIETTCPCVEVASVPLRINPGERQAMSVSFDSSSEPKFVGALRIDMTGFDKGGRCAFKARVAVEVRRSPKGSGEGQGGRRTRRDAGEPRLCLRIRFLGPGRR